MNGRLRIGVVIGLVLVSLPLAPGPGQSQEAALSVYENWSGARIRGDRWRGGEVSNGQEVVRELVSAGSFGNYLSMGLRREGETDSNIGSRTSSTFLNFANPASIVQIEALMGVLDVLVEQCSANPTPSEARLLIAMTPFNNGSSTGAGDRTGDYNAIVQAIRRSNSADPAGILRVEGRVTRCQNPACSNEREIVGPQDLGVSLAVGAAFTMRLIWDAPNNQFLAGVNANTVALPYGPANDARPAAQRSAGIEIRNTTANCSAGAMEADLEAGVGPVRTSSGSPPVVPPVTPPPVIQPPPFPPTPPPTTPPPVIPPPVTPPPVTPPPTTPPPGDNTPFVFPTQPPYNATDPSARYTFLGNDPATGGPFYAALFEYANPLPGSHWYAGQLPDGRRLWVPKEAQPAAIRRVLQTGTL
jgi:hypothetical protein